MDKEILDILKILQSTIGNLEREVARVRDDFASFHEDSKEVKRVQEYIFDQTMDLAKFKSDISNKIDIISLDAVEIKSAINLMTIKAVNQDIKITNFCKRIDDNKF